MKIAVSSNGKGLQSLVEPRFGRCPYFVIVETDSMKNETVPNLAVGSAHGAGIGAAQLVVSRGAKVILTGNVGPNAYTALTASNIEVVTGVTGIVEEAIRRYINGELKPTRRPTVGGHFGQKGTRQAGRGRGRRRV